MIRSEDRYLDEAEDDATTASAETNSSSRRGESGSAAFGTPTFSVETTISTHTPPPNQGVDVEQRSPNVGEKGQAVRVLLRMLRIQDIDIAFELMLENGISETDEFLILSDTKKQHFLASMKVSGLGIVDRTKLINAMAGETSRYQARKAADEDWITSTDLKLNHYNAQDEAAAEAKLIEAKLGLGMGNALVSPDSGFETPEMRVDWADSSPHSPHSPEVKTQELQVRAQLQEASAKLSDVLEESRISIERKEEAERSTAELEARGEAMKEQIRQSELRLKEIQAQAQAAAARALYAAGAQDQPQKYVKVETPHVSDKQDEESAAIEIEQLYGHRPVECRRHLRLSYVNRRMVLGRREARGWLRNLPEGQFSWEEWADWLRWLEQQDQPLNKLPWQKWAPKMEAYFKSMDNPYLEGEASLLPGFDDYRSVGNAYS